MLLMDPASAQVLAILPGVRSDVSTVTLKEVAANSASVGAVYEVVKAVIDVRDLKEKADVARAAAAAAEEEEEEEP